MPVIIQAFSNHIIYLVIFVFIFQFTEAAGQETNANIDVDFKRNPADTLRTDSTRITEKAPLDIDQNRGIYIIAPDAKLQLRILGSIRYLIVFDQLDLLSKNSLTTYEIPTGDLNQPLPNYFNGLGQSRIGFEVTRHNANGDVFIRLESDFVGGFRIRHAYGQYGKFLFGQTWSLFSHLAANPATVDFAGPTSSVVTRTPQIRFTANNLIKGVNTAFGLEYIIPNLTLADSTLSESFQLLPDLTVRLDKTFPWGFVQISGILPIVSGLNNQDDAIVKAGWGISASTVINSWKKGKWYIQAAAGRAITRFFNDLSTSGMDLEFGPDNRIVIPAAYGFYATYEHQWKTRLMSNFTYGWLQIENFDFNEASEYHKGHTLRINTFFDVIEGSRIGLEGIWGNRVDNDRDKGDALRINLLFYYDF